MSLITRCPACGTLFKVVDDQLKISEGWVRCGQCREVFDALAQMVNQSTAQLTQETTQGPVVNDYAVSREASDSKSHVSSQEGTVTSIVTQNSQDFESSDWINSVNPPAPREQRSPDADDHPPSLLPQDLTNEELAMLGMAPVENTPEQVEKKSGTPAPLPSFVRKAQRVQRLRSPWTRVMLGLAVMLLTLILCMQVVVHERDRIAALEPRAVPWIQRTCDLLGCKLASLKQIESIVVDASGFNKLRADGKSDSYKFTITLKNNSAIAIAVPHIELSLNDSQDQAVVRRVLSPADLGATRFVLAPSGDFSGATTLQVDSAQLANTRIAGYRVWAFYP
jgi:predicted Zn finger-like uncharacterized protein